MKLITCVLYLAFVLVPSMPTVSAIAQAIKIADLKRATPVDFQKEIFPFLKQNCISCHNQTDADGELVLESPQTIALGGESGPVVVPGKADESLLLRVCAKLEKPFMPPTKNKVDAKPLTSEQLGLLKLWINQGAGGKIVATKPKENWQRIAKGLQPIYAAAISPDGQYVAAGRANQIYMYHLPTNRLVAKLTDPDIKEKVGPAAHLDLVQSLAFSEDGKTLASGGYQVVKIWTLPESAVDLKSPVLDAKGLNTVCVNSSGEWAAVGGVDGVVRIIDLKTQTLKIELKGSAVPINTITLSNDQKHLIAGSNDKHLYCWQLSDGKLLGKSPMPAIVRVLLTLPTGQFASAGDDDAIRLWAMDGDFSKPLKLVNELKGHAGRVRCLTLADKAGAQIISGGQDGTVRHWQLADKKQLRVVNHGSPVTSVLIIASQNRIISADEAGGISFWQLSDGKLVKQIKGNGRLVDDIALQTQAVQFVNEELKYIHDKQNKAEVAQKAKAAELVKIATEKENAVKDVAAKQAAQAQKVAERDKTIQGIATAKNNLNTAKQNQNQLTQRIAQLTTQVNQAKAKSDQGLVALNQIKQQAGASQTAMVNAQKKHADESNALKVLQEQSEKLKVELAAALKLVENTQGEIAKFDAELKAAQTDAAAKQSIADEAIKNKAPDAGEKIKIANDAKQVVAQKQMALQVQQQKIKDASATKVKTEQLVAAKQAEVTGKQKIVDDALKALNTAIAKQKTDAAGLAEMNKNYLAVKAQYDAGVAELNKTNTAKVAADKAVVDLDNAIKAGVAQQKKLDGEINAAGKAVVAAVNAKNQKVSQLYLVMAGTRDQVIDTQETVNKALHVQRRLDGMQNVLGGLQKQYDQSVKPVRQLFFDEADGVVIAVSASGDVVTYHAETGDAFARQQMGVADITDAGYFNNRVLSVNKKGLLLGIKAQPRWQYERAIGGIVKGKPQIVDRVLSISFHPDHETIATAGGVPSRAGELKLWNIHNGQLVKNIETEHKNTINRVAFSPDGTMVATASSDKSAGVFDALTGKRIFLLEGHTNYVLGVDWSKHGRLLTTVGADQVLKIWNMETGTQIKTVGGYAKQVTDVDYVGYSDNFVVAGGDKQIKQHKPDGGVIRGFGGALDYVYSVDVDVRGQLLVSGGYDSVLRVWNIADGKLVHQFAPEKPEKD